MVMFMGVGGDVEENSEFWSGEKSCYVGVDDEKNKNVILDIFLLLKNNSCGVTRKLLLASTTSPIFESSFFCTHQYLAFHTKTITR